MAEISEKRISALGSIPLADTTKAVAALRAQRATTQDFGPVFERLSVTDTAGAARFSKAFLTSIETRDQATQFFDEIARAKPADRLPPGHPGGESGCRGRPCHCVGREFAP
jgi:hypothetical protein